MNAIAPLVTHSPNSGPVKSIRMTREPQTAFGWAKLKAIHVPAGWYEIDRPPIGDRILIQVKEQTGTILGWWGLHGENVIAKVEID